MSEKGTREKRVLTGHLKEDTEFTCLRSYRPGVQSGQMGDSVKAHFRSPQGSQVTTGS